MTFYRRPLPRSSVHVLITPKISIPRIRNGFKGSTSHQPNSILSREGEHFWQDESFDLWVRSSKEFDKIRAHIENNPVSAGLATAPQDWPCSSCSS